jgi:hypothetical protein
VFAAWWEGVDWGDWAPHAELGRLLWHERDSLLQELAGLPPGQVELAVDAGRRRPRRMAPGAVGLGPRPLAMLGVLDVPASMSPSPSWFALTGTAPALLAAAAISGPEPPPSLSAAAAN